MAYQSAKVGVAANAGQLLITDLASGDLIAEHVISLEKGQIIKNTHHYRDMTAACRGAGSRTGTAIGRQRQPAVMCAIEGNLAENLQGSITGRQAVIAGIRAELWPYQR